MYVFINLKGGLGNQLFQIATGYAYSKKEKKDLLLSESWWGISCHRPSYWHNLLQNLRHFIKEKPADCHYYGEPIFNHRDIPSVTGNIELHGYFQTDKYFIDYEDEIRNLFRIPASFEHLDIPNKTITVAIHIRRGDYLKASHFHTILPKSYYDTAKKIIEKEIGFRPNYHYFSDDREWVKENFGDSLQEGNKIITNATDIEDFIQMKNCHHFIIANSSFSWWAAWLSVSDSNKKVVAPNNWFVSQESWWEDIYCKDWIRI